MKTIQGQKAKQERIERAGRAFWAVFAGVLILAVTYAVVRWM